MTLFFVIGRTRGVKFLTVGGTYTTQKSQAYWFIHLFLSGETYSTYDKYSICI